MMESVVAQKPATVKSEPHSLFTGYYPERAIEPLFLLFLLFLLTVPVTKSPSLARPNELYEIRPINVLLLIR